MLDCHICFWKFHTESWIYRCFTGCHFNPWRKQISAKCMSSSWSFMGRLHKFGNYTTRFCKVKSNFHERTYIRCLLAEFEKPYNRSQRAEILNIIKAYDTVARYMSFPFISCLAAVFCINEYIFLVNYTTLSQQRFKAFIVFILICFIDQIF